MIRVLLLSGVVALTSYGQLMIKARALVHAARARPGEGRLAYLGQMFADVLTLSALGAAVLASILWILAIEKTDLAYAYPFLALPFVVVPVGSALLLGERLSSLQLAGAVAIVVGVALSAASR